MRAQMNIACLSMIQHLDGSVIHHFFELIVLLLIDVPIEQRNVKENVSWKSRTQA